MKIMYKNSMFFRQMTLALVLPLFWCVAAEAQCSPEQTFKLLPDDGTSASFGSSVAINGPIAIVGGPDDDINGFLSGSAHLFDTTTGKQIAQLLPDDFVEDEHFFGRSVAINDAIALVGASSYFNDDGIKTGAVYVFNPKTGQQIDKWSAEDGQVFDTFGKSVAISGTTAIIGAGEDDDNGDGSGSAYLFDATTGEQIFKLLPDDGAPNDWFGDTGSVAISGNLAIVGARRDDDNGEDSGSAYLFDVTTGQQIAKLLPDDGAPGDFFCRPAIGGNRAVIGAYHDDDNGTDSGSAYIFDTTTGQQIAKLLPDDGAAGDSFGARVSISGSIVVISASRDDDNGEDSGAAYLFDIDTGQQLAKLLADDGAGGDRFGLRVACSGITAIATARYDDNKNGVGSAYLFDISSCVVVLGDVNLDGVVDLLDVQPFIDLLVSGDFQTEADINQDGVVDLLDVQPFVDLLTG